MAGIQNWYFTFGFEQAHPRGYVKIAGEFNEARDEMFRRYGPKWAFQYSETEFLPQIERFGLHEVE